MFPHNKKRKKGRSRAVLIRSFVRWRSTVSAEANAASMLDIRVGGMKPRSIITSTATIS